MGGPRAARLVDAVLRCYPARWRRRHGVEAAELAALLIRDGTPVGSVALSYFLGAARERLIRPGRRVGSAVGCLSGQARIVMAAVLVGACSLGVSVGLLASTVPARAASTTRPGRPAHCRTVQAGGVKKEIQAGDHPQLKTGEAGESAHGQSC